MGLLSRASKLRKKQEKEKFILQNKERRKNRLKEVKITLRSFGRTVAIIILIPLTLFTSSFLASVILYDQGYENIGEGIMKVLASIVGFFVNMFQ